MEVDGGWMEVEGGGWRLRGVDGIFVESWYIGSVMIQLYLVFGSKEMETPPFRGRISYNLRGKTWVLGLLDRPPPPKKNNNKDTKHPHSRKRIILLQSIVFLLVSGCSIFSSLWCFCLAPKSSPSPGKFGTSLIRAKLCLVFFYRFTPVIFWFRVPLAFFLPAKKNKKIQGMAVVNKKTTLNHLKKVSFNKEPGVFVVFPCGISKACHSNRFKEDSGCFFFHLAFVTI